MSLTIMVALIGYGWHWLFPIQDVYADNTGVRTATASTDCTNDATVGTVAWTNPGNAFSSNGSSATYSTTSTTAALTNYVKCLNFGFTSGMIPTGSTINGIVATVGKSKGVFGTTVDNSIKLVKGGVIGGNDNKSVAAWATSITATNYGSSSDLWGQTWAISDITASNFGVAFSASVKGTGSFSGTANVDYMQLTVYFTPPPVTTTQAGYRVFANNNSTDVGSPLAALNTKPTLTSTGQAFRVRNLVNVATNPLLTSQTFNLQYVDQGTGSCATPSGGTPSSWTNVTNAVAGSSWTLATSSPAWSANADTPMVNLNGTLFVFSGGGIATSTDGVTWTQRNSPPSAPRATNLLVFNNKVWVIGGVNSGGTFLNSVYSTTDGSTYTQATAAAGWSIRGHMVVLSYNGYMWAMAGEDSSAVHNDVWYSSDGATWTQATSSANWSTRTQASGEVLNNKMWVMGGWDNSTNIYNDVWSSSDGITWTQATASANWSTRYGQATVVANNQLVLIGGDHTSAASGVVNDVWTSSDGVTWTQSTASAPWAARDAFGATIFNNQIWIGGGELSAGNTHDIWYADTPTLIAFNDNTTPTDDSALTTNANDPTDGGNTVVAESYQELNMANTTTQVPVGQDGMWDFSLIDNGAAAGSTYCFRMVKADGTTFNTYTYYPQVTTYSGVISTPTPSNDQLLRHGTWFYNGVKQPMTF